MKKIYQLILLFIPIGSFAQTSGSPSDTLKKPVKDTVFQNVANAPHQFLSGLSVPSPGAAGLGKFVDMPVNFNNGLPQITIPIARVSEAICNCRFRWRTMPAGYA